MSSTANSTLQANLVPTLSLLFYQLPGDLSDEVKTLVYEEWKKADASRPAEHLIEHTPGAETRAFAAALAWIKQTKRRLRDAAIKEATEQLITITNRRCSLLREKMREDLDDSNFLADAVLRNKQLNILHSNEQLHRISHIDDDDDDVTSNSKNRNSIIESVVENIPDVTLHLERGVESSNTDPASEDGTQDTNTASDPAEDQDGPISAFSTNVMEIGATKSAVFVCRYRKIGDIHIPPSMVNNFVRSHPNPIPAVLFGPNFARKNPYFQYEPRDAFQAKPMATESEIELPGQPYVCTEQNITSREPKHRTILVEDLENVVINSETSLESMPQVLSVQCFSPPDQVIASSLIRYFFQTFPGGFSCCYDIFRVLYAYTFPPVNSDNFILPLSSVPILINESLIQQVFGDGNIELPEVSIQDLDNYPSTKTISKYLVDLYSQDGKLQIQHHYKPSIRKIIGTIMINVCIAAFIDNPTDINFDEVAHYAFQFPAAASAIFAIACPYEFDRRAMTRVGWIQDIIGGHTAMNNAYGIYCDRKFDEMLEEDEDDLSGRSVVEEDNENDEDDEDDEDSDRPIDVDGNFLMSEETGYSTQPSSPMFTAFDHNQSDTSRSGDNDASTTPSSPTSSGCPGGNVDKNDSIYPLLQNSQDLTAEMVITNINNNYPFPTAARYQNAELEDGRYMLTSDYVDSYGEDEIHTLDLEHLRLDVESTHVAESTFPEPTMNPEPTGKICSGGTLRRIPTPSYEKVFSAGFQIFAPSKNSQNEFQHVTLKSDNLQFSSSFVTVTAASLATPRIPTAQPIYGDTQSPENLYNPPALALYKPKYNTLSEFIQAEPLNATYVYLESFPVRVPPQLWELMDQVVTPDAVEAGHLTFFGVPIPEKTWGYTDAFQSLSVEQKQHLDYWCEKSISSWLEIMQDKHGAVPATQLKFTVTYQIVEDHRAIEGFRKLRAEAKSGNAADWANGSMRKWLLGEGMPIELIKSSWQRTVDACTKDWIRSKCKLTQDLRDAAASPRRYKPATNTLIFRQTSKAAPPTPRVAPNSQNTPLLTSPGDTPNAPGKHLRDDEDDDAYDHVVKQVKATHSYIGGGQNGESEEIARFLAPLPRRRTTAPRPIRPSATISSTSPGYSSKMNAAGKRGRDESDVGREHQKYLAKHDEQEDLSHSVHDSLPILETDPIIETSTDAETPTANEEKENSDIEALFEGADEP